MRLLAVISSVIIFGITSNVYAQAPGMRSPSGQPSSSENVIVDDGGSLKMMPADQVPQNQPQARSGQRPPQQASPPRASPGSSTKGIKIPGVSAVEDPSLKRRMMENQLSQIKDQLPPEMQNLTPEQYEKLLDEAAGK